MIRHRLLFLALCLLPVYLRADSDSILISSIEVRNDVGSIDCATSNLTINAKAYVPLCELGRTIDNTTYLTLTYNGTDPVKEGNITFFLTSKVTNIYGNETISVQYSGVFVLDKNAKPNLLSEGTLAMTKYVPPTTTVAPSTKKTKKKRSSGFSKDIENDETGPIIFDASPISNQTVLTINYIILDVVKKTTQVNKNGGAVAVAIIEGIALICILAYMGYRTMVKHRMKEATMNAALYGYDNNSRITVPDSMRMSDIPPPRDATYATPPAPTVQQPVRSTVMTTQELVVPQTSASATRPTTTTPNTTNGQFNDPFDSLDSW